MRTEVSDPDARDNFKYPDLSKHVLEHRGEILAALLTVARAWFAAECPMPEKKLRKVGSFTEWSHTTGGMLAYAGVEGFLENIDELRKEADVDGAAWTRFLELWQSKLGDQAYKTADLISQMGCNAELAEALPTEYLATLYAKEEKTFSRVLGRVLAKQNGTPYGPKNLRLIKGEDAHAKVATFRVVAMTVIQGTKAPEVAPEPEAPPAVETDVATTLLNQVMEMAAQKDTKTLLWNMRDSIYERGEIPLAEFQRRIKAGIHAGGKERQIGIQMMRRLLATMNGA
jgi:hypothetical protein